MRFAIPLLTFVFAVLPLAAEDGYIRARGSPTGAGLFVDGKYIGPAGRFTVPEKYQIPEGEHEVVLRDPRFEDYSTKVTIRPGKTTKIRYKLKKVEPAKPPFGRLRLGGGEPESFMSVASGDTGPIYINDRFYGFVDEFNNVGGGILLNPGTYRLRVESQLYNPINQDVTIEANKVTVIPLVKR